MLFGCPSVLLLSARCICFSDLSHNLLCNYITMAYKYSNIEYTEMVRMLARCDDNVSEACRQYAARYPHLPTPSRETMSAATQRLRDYGQFQHNMRDSGRPPRRTKVQTNKTKIKEEGEEDVGKQKKNLKNGKRHSKRNKISRDAAQEHADEIDYGNSDELPQEDPAKQSLFPPSMVDFNLCLIREVEKYPCLYDSTNPAYNKIKIEKDIWMEIAEAVGSTDKICRTQWEIIQTTYIKSLKQLLPVTYYLAPHLTFLEPFIITEDTDPLNMEVKAEIDIEEINLNVELSLPLDHRQADTVLPSTSTLSNIDQKVSEDRLVTFEVETVILKEEIEDQ